MNLKYYKIINFIRERNEANPFSDEFNKEIIANEFEDKLKQDEIDLFKFLFFCNDLYVDTKKSVFQLFEKLNYNYEQFVDFILFKTNYHFIRQSKQIFDSAHDSVLIENSKKSLSVINDDYGNEIGSQYAIELSGEIASQLIFFAKSFCSNYSPKEGFVKLSEDEADIIFQKLSIYVNILFNIKNSAFEIIRWESGKVIYDNSNKLKVENDLISVHEFNKVGTIRSASQIQEILYPLIQIYSNTKDKITGIHKYSIKDKVLAPISGEANHISQAYRHSHLIQNYSHLAGIKLDYFGDLELREILDVAGLISECLELIIENKYQAHEETNEVPVKFIRIELIETLTKISKCKLLIVERIIDSLTTEEPQPYFWKSPFIKIGEYLYFSMASTISPNYFLYFEKWLALSKIDLAEQQNLFVNALINELKNDNICSFSYSIIDFSALKVDTDEFKSNILIELKDIYILLEMCLYNFPIESSEIEYVLDILHTASIAVKKKGEILKDRLNNKKEVKQLIISNYNNFSGLQINDISVADLGLFYNYFKVGKFSKASVTFKNGIPSTNISSEIKYYNNEVEFNKHFALFFKNPMPVFQILSKFKRRDLTITPPYFTPSISIDITEHISDEELTSDNLNNLEYLVNTDYFSEPIDKQSQSTLDDSIIFSLSEIFTRLAHAPYSSHSQRLEIYNKINKTKSHSITHLTYYIFKSLEKINTKRIIKKEKFNLVEYNPDELIEILKRSSNLTNGQIRISDFVIENDVFSEAEELQLISFAIDMLEVTIPKLLYGEGLELIIMPLGILKGLSGRHEILNEFYIAIGNIIDGLNYSHRYQLARDFCEEIMLLASNSNKHPYGWHILFKCYTHQKNILEASTNCCLYLTSILMEAELEENLVIETLYGLLKYFRNFGYHEYAIRIFQNLQNLSLNEYDKQKIALSFYHSVLQYEVGNDVNCLNQIVEYVDLNFDVIVKYDAHGIIPWLSILYNIERLVNTKQINYTGDYQLQINRLENCLDKENIIQLRNKIIGQGEQTKSYFVSILLSSLETRQVEDFKHETQHLEIHASQLIQWSLEHSDSEGLLLAGKVINDQSLTYDEKSVTAGSIKELSSELNEEYKLRLNNYKYYILSMVNISSNQLLIWLFEDLGKIYLLRINSFRVIEIDEIKNWDLKKINIWLLNLKNFYFNAKKDETGISRSLFSNPRAESDYNDLIQKEDYISLINELKFTDLNIDDNIEEIFFCSSIDMSNFPYNLIISKNDFLGRQFPICNIFSFEYFLEKNTKTILKSNYSISAWIPIEDQEFVLAMGYDRLLPTLESISAKIYTSKYPTKFIDTDLNIFMAHGILDNFGFKAVYTNPSTQKAIVEPQFVFGCGKIAILFICNSGSSIDEHFSNSITSFSNQILRLGYESVIAPFWSFDVSMSKIWLDMFLEKLNSGESVNWSVWYANNQLAKYDEETSSLFLAPSGCLCMHLHGNPNVFVQK